MLSNGSHVPHIFKLGVQRQAEHSLHPVFTCSVSMFPLRTGLSFMEPPCALTTQHVLPQSGAARSYHSLMCCEIWLQLSFQV